MSINAVDGGYQVNAKDGNSVMAKYVVNCAGLFSDKIANMVGDYSFKITPRRGEYVLLDKECGSIVKHTIFRTPTKMGKGILVSPTIVRISPDLSVARVYISVFPTNKEQEILDLMNEKSVSIRHDLAQRTRHQLRTVPTLTFFLDDSLDYLENIDQLLKA
jgi:ribosome-binding factor A